MNEEQRISYAELIYAFQRLYPDEYASVVDVLSFSQQAQAKLVEEDDGTDVPDG